MTSRAMCGPMATEAVAAGEGAFWTWIASGDLTMRKSSTIVDVGVDDAAVVPGLVRGEPLLLLEDDQPEIGTLREERARRGEPDDMGFSC
jgi:hypothetical protein